MSLNLNSYGLGFYSLFHLQNQQTSADYWGGGGLKTTGLSSSSSVFIFQFIKEESLSGDSRDDITSNDSSKSRKIELFMVAEWKLVPFQQLLKSRKDHQGVSSTAKIKWKRKIG